MLSLITYPNYPVTRTRNKGIIAGLVAHHSCMMAYIGRSKYDRLPNRLFGSKKLQMSIQWRAKEPMENKFKEMVNAFNKLLIIPL
jgi:hypothetical protein